MIFFRLTTDEDTPVSGVLAATDIDGALSYRSVDRAGDGVAELLGGAGAGTGPYVARFAEDDLILLDDLFTFDEEFRGGVYVAGSH